MELRCQGCKCCNIAYVPIKLCYSRGKTNRHTQGGMYLNTKSYGSTRRSSRNKLPILILGLAVLILFVIVAVGMFERHAPSTNIGAPAPAHVVRNITLVPEAVWGSFGVKNAATGLDVSPKGKPTFLYVGADGCPYCAAERWPIIVALSRFGHFSGLTLMRSNATDVYPNTPTFSFFHARFSSPYIHVALVEADGRQKAPGGGGFYPPLMKLSASQTATFEKYDSPPYIPKNYAGAIPLVLVGGQYLWIGSTYSPGILDNKSWLQISQAVRAGKGVIGQNILRNANALTAAICAVDGRRPANVCTQVGAVVPARSVT